jgi:hypothetical protein
MVDRGAVVEGFDDCFVFVGDVEVVRIYESICRAGEKDRRRCRVELKLKENIRLEAS